MALHPFQLAPHYHERVWGGTRFKHDDKKIGEAWIVYEDNVITSGDHAGLALKQLAASHAVHLLGARTLDRAGERFPLLIKLLDPADWLLLQVHPNDEQAKRLEGGNYFGKTEAWHILEAEPNAQLISGLKANTSNESLRQAIRDGTILDHAQYVDVHNGDTIFIRAGTIHALGPGLFLYEIQQTSDLT
ncbi:MAG: class I mannose-6-phosphate isomerase, partial [Chloroflexi bacterium]|nr:class I mannose-6-phosphate isomerase [Chloroflexota bacterium]